MLNLLLENRLLAFFLLNAAIWLDRTSRRSESEKASEGQSPGTELLSGVAAVAWGLVLVGMFPAFQIVFKVPEAAWVGFDSQDPIGWMVAGMCLLAMYDRFRRVSLDATLVFWSIVAAAIADDRLLSWSLLSGGVHAFQPHEGVLGLVFLLYPIAVFSGRMGFVGRCFGLGLVTLGFGILPASLVFFATGHGLQRPSVGLVLGSAAVAGAGMIGLEELGGLGRGTAVLIATGMFMFLSLAGSKRSTEVRA